MEILSRKKYLILIEKLLENSDRRDSIPMHSHIVLSSGKITIARAAHKVMQV